MNNPILELQELSEVITQPGQEHPGQGGGSSSISTISTIGISSLSVHC